jgi:hypothetical protein
MWACCTVPVNDAFVDRSEELVELRAPHCLAPRREHVVGQMKMIVLPLVVWPKEIFNRTPHRFHRVCMIPG